MFVLKFADGYDYKINVNTNMMQSYKRKQHYILHCHIRYRHISYNYLKPMFIKFDIRYHYKQLQRTRKETLYTPVHVTILQSSFMVDMNERMYERWTIIIWPLHRDHQWSDEYIGIYVAQIRCSNRANCLPSRSTMGEYLTYMHLVPSQNAIFVCM
jgi:hypothetical protein